MTVHFVVRPFISTPVTPQADTHRRRTIVFPSCSEKPALSLGYGNAAGCLWGGGAARAGRGLLGTAARDADGIKLSKSLSARLIQLCLGSGRISSKLNDNNVAIHNASFDHRLTLYTNGVTIGTEETAEIYFILTGNSLDGFACGNLAQ